MYLSKKEAGFKYVLLDLGLAKPPGKLLAHIAQFCAFFGTGKMLQTDITKAQRLEVRISVEAPGNYDWLSSRWPSVLPHLVVVLFRVRGMIVTVGNLIVVIVFIIVII